MCVYTTATAAVTKIKGKNCFRVRFRSNIKEPLSRAGIAQSQTKVPPMLILVHGSKTTGLPCWTAKRSASVTPDVNLGNLLHTGDVQSM